MSRMVFCRKYQCELEGLDQPPYPGAKGQDMFNNISKKAWGEWMQHQTMLINEKRLNMMDLTARAYLGEQMEKFFAGENVDQIDGYTAED